MVRRRRKPTNVPDGAGDDAEFPDLPRFVNDALYGAGCGVGRAAAPLANGHVALPGRDRERPVTTALFARPRAWFHSLGSRARAGGARDHPAGRRRRPGRVGRARGRAPGVRERPRGVPPPGRDDRAGEGYANALVDIANVTRREHHEAPLAAEPASFYPPGYPVFVAAVTWTVWHTPIPDGDLVRTIEYVQALLGMLTILMVFLLAPPRVRRSDRPDRSRDRRRLPQPRRHHRHAPVRDVLHRDAAPRHARAPSQRDAATIPGLCGWSSAAR